jgi:hypothetical protein
MSKQFQIYVLPSDLERLVTKLRDQLNVRVISSVSSEPRPTELDSPIRKGSMLRSEDSVSADCCFTPNVSANVRMIYYPNPSIWRVADISELVSVSGCDFDGSTLVRGRFYVQTDILVGGEIIRKQVDFLKWADEVFRFAKKQLHRSKTLDAYVGDDALQWEKQGGRFASFALPGHKPIYEHASSRQK